MTITYTVGNALYINLTNRCPNRCSFCIRTKRDGVGSGTNLWLDKEPTVEQVMADMSKWEVARYRELVFCGFGEPLARAEDLIEICRRLKRQYDKPIRINTNGQANLIYGQDITPRLAGLVDAVSISLNAPDSDRYRQLCRPSYGEAAFDALLDFAVKCQQHIPQVILTVVDLLSDDEIEKCRKIARRIGVNFRVRHFIS